MIDTTFTRVPRPVSDALQRGEISLSQFNLLVMMHSVADWRTGIVKSWSAKQFFYLCGEMNPTDADCKKMRRAQAELRARGWYSHDYIAGPKRPYNGTLNNFVVYGPIQRNDQENSSENDQGSYVINLHDIKTYNDSLVEDDQDESLGRDQENVQESLGQMSLKDQIRSQPSASTRPAAGSPTEMRGQGKTDGSQESARLREVIGWVPDTAPKTLARLLQTFSFNDIVAEFKPLAGSNGYYDSNEIAAEYSKGGAKLEAGLRWNRRQSETTDGLVNIIGVNRQIARAIVQEHGAWKVLETLRADAEKKPRAKS